MNKKIRWGILGAGRIAQKFASDLKLVEDAELFAIASRGQFNAAIFAVLYPAALQYDNYEDLVQNPEVDIIYIATPHGLHYEHTLLCIQHGKAVLCEKAFALNVRQAREMISTARARKVFLMEALWSKFIPSWQKNDGNDREWKTGRNKKCADQFRVYSPRAGRRSCF